MMNLLKNGIVTFLGRNVEFSDCSKLLSHNSSNKRRRTNSCRNVTLSIGTSASHLEHIGQTSYFHVDIGLNLNYLILH